MLFRSEQNGGAPAQPPAPAAQPVAQSATPAAAPVVAPAGTLGKAISKQVDDPSGEERQARSEKAKPVFRGLIRTLAAAQE